MLSNSMKQSLKSFFEKYPCLYRFLLALYTFPKRLRIRLAVSVMSRDVRNKKGYKPILRHGGLGVVIGEGVYIGKNVIINQNVTIGNKNGCPIIQDNVRIFPNCIIIGKITIGKNSIIGAGTFIDQDIPPNSIVYNKKELVVKRR